MSKAKTAMGQALDAAGFNNIQFPGVQETEELETGQPQCDTSGKNVKRAQARIIVNRGSKTIEPPTGSHTAKVLNSTRANLDTIGYLVDKTSPDQMNGVYRTRDGGKPDILFAAELMHRVHELNNMTRQVLDLWGPDMSGLKRPAPEGETKDQEVNN